ncbi:MAG: glycosyltransferase [Myxococcales bacterium]|nr:glycosyltransferase [Myxococcales bacterium]MCB9531308.1 glycosyltransferase [Myxococcales bacterium]
MSARPLRVLQLIAAGGVGGAESVVIAGARALADAGAEVTVGAIVETRAPDRAESFLARAAARGLSTVRWTSHGRADLGLVVDLGRSIRRDGYDVVHAHGYKAVVLSAAATPLKTRYFVTHHGQGGHDKKVGAYVRASFVGYRRAASVFAVSEATAQHLRDEGIGRARIRVLPNFLSLPASCVLDPPAPPAPPLQLAFLGRLSPEKGCDVLLQALAWCASDVELVVYGDGAERGRLELRARDLQVNDRVRFAGFVDDVAGAIGRAHAVVLPSRSEGLPMVLVEALALGRPAIATAVGGVPEVLDGSGPSQLVAPDDPAALASAIDTLAHTVDERLHAARAHAPGVRERFAASTWASATLAAYTSA